jgi:hypothetical protein
LEPNHQDLYGEAVAAMRKQGMLIGAYVSKADWHAHSYWDESLSFPTTTAVNYDIAKLPEKWREYSNFTRLQYAEIQVGGLQVQQCRQCWDPSGESGNSKSEQVKQWMDLETLSTLATLGAPTHLLYYTVHTGYTCFLIHTLFDLL